MFAFIVRLPQPLKALYLAWFVAFALVLVAFFLRSKWATSLASGLLGVVAVLVGLTLLTNLNNSAEALAEATKSYRPLGIDYSGSVLASPRFTRLFGLMMLVVGAIFVGDAVAHL